MKSAGAAVARKRNLPPGATLRQAWTSSGERASFREIQYHYFQFVMAAIDLLNR